MSQYSYDIDNDFNGIIPRGEHLARQIKKYNLSTFTHINIEMSTREVILFFSASLSAEELATLSGVVSTYVPLSVNPTKYFDTVVDSKDSGEYVSIAEAFASGATSVYVRDGIYVETSDIVIPDGGQLYGESQGNVKIVLVGQVSLKLDGSGGIFKDDGTISVSNNSVIVTGTGTSFNSGSNPLLPGQFVLLGTNYLEILSIESDTSLTLRQLYVGKDLQDSEYIAQQMLTGCSVSNVVLLNSLSDGLFVRGVRHSGFFGIAIINCSPNMSMRESGDMAVETLICYNSKSAGVTFSNCYSVSVSVCDIYNCATDGILMTDSNTTNVLSVVCSCNNQGSGLRVIGECRDLQVGASTFKHNVDHGIFMDEMSERVQVTSCVLSENGGFGAKLDGAGHIITASSLHGNDAGGLELHVDSVVCNTQIVSNGSHGLSMRAGAMSNSICNVICRSNAVNGMNISGARTSVNGCCFCNNQNIGIYVGGDTSVINSSRATDNTSDGIFIDASDCVISSVISHNNAGTGLTVNTGATTNLAVNSNIKNNTGLNFVDLGTSTTTSNLIVI